MVTDRDLIKSSGSTPFIMKLTLHLHLLQRFLSNNRWLSLLPACGKSVHERTTFFILTIMPKVMSIWNEKPGSYRKYSEANHWTMAWYICMHICIFICNHRKYFQYWLSSSTVSLTIHVLLSLCSFTLGKLTFLLMIRR